MTKHKLICTLLLTVSICACTAEQSYKKTIGLRAVQAAFLVKFLDAKGMIWKKEIDHEFECEFKANGKKTWANFDLLGKWHDRDVILNNLGKASESRNIEIKEIKNMLSVDKMQL